MGADAFLAHARALYVELNARSLAWLLARPPLHGVFLDTKVNSITLEDYDASDGWRGPGYLYGWIQGRGLEALVTHAAFFAGEAPGLAERLLARAEPLYRALVKLHEDYGHGYFVYDSALRPVRPGAVEVPLPTRRAPELFTYADIFFVKGLLAAARCFDPSAVDRHRRRIVEIAAAIEDRRFVVEHEIAAGEPVVIEDYGPRMILLGAVPLLDEPDKAFAGNFIAHVLRHHRAAAGTGIALSDLPGGDRCNPGHAIEFAGYGLESMTGDDPQGAELEAILLGAFAAGHRSPGVCLSVSLSTGAPTSPYYPWWPLPEAIGAAAAAYRRFGNPAVLDLWRRAHDTFLSSFWRDEPALAYQTRDAQGPVDYVPATPDLDPGYHTGLSLLRAVRVIDELTERA